MRTFLIEVSQATQQLAIAVLLKTAMGILGKQHDPKPQLAGIHKIA